MVGVRDTQCVCLNAQLAISWLHAQNFLILMFCVIMHFSILQRFANVMVFPLGYDYENFGSRTFLGCASFLCAASRVP